MRLYTQNVDCLDTNIPPLATKVPLNEKGPWPLTIQLHGGLGEMVCTKCGELNKFDGSLFEGPEAPLCEQCRHLDEVRTTFGGKRSHGIGRVRPRIVLYNEETPDATAIGAVVKADLRRVPDAVIVVGTTLKIPGVRRIVKELCQVTRSRRDGFTAWLNIDPEPQGPEFRDCWDLVVAGRCDDVAELVNLPRWDEPAVEDSCMVTGHPDREESAKLDVEREHLEVILGAKPSLLPEADSQLKLEEVSPSNEAKSKLIGQTQGGMLTPIASPRIRTALPDASNKNKIKQGKLLFPAVKANKAKSTPKTTAEKESKKPAAPKSTKAPKVTKRREVRKGQKQAKAKNPLPFKATKIVPLVEGKPEVKTPQKALPHDGDSSDLSSPPREDYSDDIPSVLPSLRDPLRPAPMVLKQHMATPDPITAEADSAKRPSTPPCHRRQASLDTISPRSRPRGMVNLID